MGKGGQTKSEPIATSDKDAKYNANENTSISNSQVSETNNLASKTFFTREEVAKHNKKSDSWIIVNDNVYNVTNFLSKHPGGSSILGIYSGQDATEVFNAFHKDLEKVFKYSKAYHIGKLHPNESIFLTNKTNTTINNTENQIEFEKIQKQNEIKKDFENLRHIAYKMDLFKPSYLFFFLHGFHIVFLHILGYYILWKFGSGLLPVALALFCHIIAQAQSDWTQHDYGHSSLFAKPIYNTYLQMFFLGTIKGASAEWWKYRHNQHHAKPNVIGKDFDTRVDPLFVLGDVHPIRRAEKNAKKIESYIYPYTFQHYYFCLAAPLLFPVYFQIVTLHYVFKRKNYRDLISMIPMYIIHFGITYHVFQSWSQTLIYYMLMRFVESTWFTWVSQCNHIVMDIHDDDECESWLSMQLRATCNITSSWFNDWFTGHLNLQIEHHLFPTMPRHNLHKITPLVKSLCKKHNIRYVSKPLFRAFFDIMLSLKKSGQLWQEAYEEFILPKND